MRNFILAAACVLTATFATSTAMADHYGYRQSFHRGPSFHPYGRGGFVTPYHAYRYSPAFSNRYYGYRSPYYGQVYHHNYHYARPGFGSNAFGVQGGNFSLYLGF